MEDYMPNCSKTALSKKLFPTQTQRMLASSMLPCVLNIYRLVGWQAYNDASLAVTAEIAGVSTALPNSLQLSVPSWVTGPIGFENVGYWGNFIV